jgi:hypothetical protein
VEALYEDATTGPIHVGPMGDPCRAHVPCRALVSKAKAQQGRRAGRAGRAEQAEQSSRVRAVRTITVRTVRTQQGQAGQSHE